MARKLNSAVYTETAAGLHHENLARAPPLQLAGAPPEFRAERVDLVRVVDDFVRAYPLEELVIEREASAREIVVRGDRQLLRQVLVNLVENATVAMRAWHADTWPMKLTLSRIVYAVHSLWFRL